MTAPKSAVRELTDAGYAEAVRLCRSVVDAVSSDDGGPMVAGSFLGRLRSLLTRELAAVELPESTNERDYSELNSDLGVQVPLGTVEDVAVGRVDSGWTTVNALYRDGLINGQSVVYDRPLGSVCLRVDSCAVSVSVTAADLTAAREFEHLKGDSGRPLLRGLPLANRIVTNGPTACRVDNRRTL